MPLSMPSVAENQDLPTVFSEARKLSAGRFALPGQPDKQRYIAIITPGRHTASVPCPLPEKMTPEMIERVREIVPEEKAQAVTVIANNRIPEHGHLTLKTLAANMPFLGYLLGIAYVGHTVVVFEGHPSALAEGCRGADMLMIDEEMLDALQSDWLEVVAMVMRQARVRICTRDGAVLEMELPKDMLVRRDEALKQVVFKDMEEEAEEEELDFDFLNDEDEKPEDPNDAKDAKKK